MLSIIYDSLQVLRHFPDLVVADVQGHWCQPDDVGWAEIRYHPTRDQRLIDPPCILMVDANMPATPPHWVVRFVSIPSNSRANREPRDRLMKVWNAS